jgi:hypothetical protein
MPVMQLDLYTIPAAYVLLRWPILLIFIQNESMAFFGEIQPRVKEIFSSKRRLLGL